MKLLSRSCLAALAVVSAAPLVSHATPQTEVAAPSPLALVERGEHSVAVVALRERLASEPDAIGEALTLASLLVARDDVEGALAVLASSLESGATHPLAAGALALVSDLVERSPSGGAPVRAVLQKLVSGEAPTADPEVLSLARLTLAGSVLRGGDRPRAIEIVSGETGRIETWRFEGPFGRFRQLAFERTHPPENGTWSEDAVSLRHADGLVSVPVSMRTPGVVYAVADLLVAAPTDARVRIATGASVSLFVDGSRAIHLDRSFGDVDRAAAARVSFEPGRHRIMVKLTSGGSNDPFSVAIEPVAGAGSLDFEEVAVGSDAVAESSHEPWPVVSDAAMEKLSSHDLPSSIAAWLWLRGRGFDERAGEILVAAQERWNESPLLQLLLGEHLVASGSEGGRDERLARARGLFESALAKDDELHRAALWLARMEFAAGRNLDAWNRIDGVLASSQASIEALLLRAEIARRASWLPEALESLERALDVAPGMPDVLEAASDFYRATGAIEKLDATLEQLAPRRLQSAARARFLGDAGRTDEAVAAWEEILAFNPSTPRAWERLTRTLADAGRWDDALGVLDRALAILPDAAWIPRERAQILAVRGRGDAALDRLEVSLELAPGQLALRSVLEREGRLEPLEPYLADVKRLLREAPRPQPGVDSALLADIAALSIDANGGQTELYQGVHSVYTRAGVEHEGELAILPGSRVESIRLHKPDGRIVDVPIDGRRPIAIPGLEPGDSIEYVWKRYIPPLGSIKDALDNQTRFIFQASDREYLLSKYVVLHDETLDVEVCGNFDRLDVTDETESNRRIRTFTAEKMPRQRREPHTADLMEVTPHVRLGYGLTWGDIGDRIRDLLLVNVAPSRSLTELADTVRDAAGSDDEEALVRALHRVIQERMRPGGASLSFALSAGAFASTGEGNRAGVALAVARTLGLDARLLLARPLEQRGLHLDCPAPGVFGYALVAVSLDDRDVLLDYNDVDLPFDVLPARISGSDALSVPLDPERPCEVVSVPPRAPQLTRSQIANLELDPTGAVSGRLRISMGGVAAASVRIALKQVPSDRRQVVYDSIASTVFPGAVVTRAEITGADDPTNQLVLDFDVEGGTWGRRTSTGFAIPATMRTLDLASEYASLEARAFPMLLDLEGVVRDRIVLRVPEGLTVSTLPPDSYLDTYFGSYRASALVEGDTLILERTMSIPPQRIDTLDYADFRLFARQIESAERGEIQLQVESPALK